ELVSNPGNWNPYSYCHGDSVNCVDPSGYMGNMDYFSAGTEGQGASSAQEAHYGNLKADSMNPDVIADFKIQDQKLKKAELVAVGLVLVAVNGPIVVAGTIEKVTTLAIGAYMRAQ